METSLNPWRFVRGLVRLARGRTAPTPSLAGNPVLQVLLRRRSIRRFRPEPIPEDVLQAILEAGRLAPSTVNFQPWSFGVYDREGWQRLFGRGIPFGAVRAVVVLGDIHRLRTIWPEIPCRPLVEYTLAAMNAGIAAFAMNIAAEACGVASVMLSETGRTGFYDAAYLKEKLALPDGVFPFLTIVFGYPRGRPLGLPPKLPLEEITFGPTYRGPDRRTLERWVEQMAAGYRATRVTDSLGGQLRRYLARIDRAEEDLSRLVYHGTGTAPPPAMDGRPAAPRR